jgi:hypothetical protein
METASKLQLDSKTVDDMTQNIKAIVQFLTNDPKASRIFHAIEEGHGKTSGWGIAQAAGVQAEEAEPLLKNLKDYGVVDSTDAGLDGYYYLTQLGYALRIGFTIAV